VLVGRSIASVALLATACQFDPAGPAGTAAEPAADAGTDEEVPAFDLVLPGPARYLYDTTTGSLEREGGEAIEVPSEVADGVRVIAAGSVLLAPEAVLRVVGELPLSIVAASAIEIDGTLDASSSLARGDAAGSSGGTVSLAARARLAVGGRILVGGAGGAGGGLSSAGGAGGGGGAIGLTAHEIVLAEGAVLSANGGGGGEGGDVDEVGRPGEDAPADGRRAHGGAGDANDGGDGGEGAGDMDAAGKPGKAGGGAEGAAGGAGGAGGVIRLVGLVTDGGAHITPLY
jgi:hypothetical protein